eukprot:ANDGO_03441.mRNA.1 hypothetical protein
MMHSSSQGASYCPKPNHTLANAQGIRFSKQRIFSLMMFLLILAPLCVVLWLSLPLSTPQSSSMSFPLYCLFFFFYIYPSIAVGHFMLGTRLPVVRIRDQAWWHLVGSVPSFVLLVILQGYLSDYYLIIVSLVSATSFIILIPTVILHAWYRFLHPSTYTLLSNAQGSEGGWKSKTPLTSSANFSDIGVKTLNEPLVSAKEWDDSGASLGQKSISGVWHLTAFRTLLQSAPTIPLTKADLKAKSIFCAALYMTLICCYAWCWIFSYLFGLYFKSSTLTDSDTKSFELQLSGAALFAFLFSLSFVPFRGFLGFLVRRSCGAASVMDVDMWTDDDSADAKEFYSSVGVEACASFFLELIFFVFFRNLFSDIHTIPVFLVMESTKYVVEDVTRFFLPLSEKWYVFRLRYLRTIPVIGRLFFSTSARSFEEEVFNKAFSYTTHVFASMSSGISYIVMLIVLRFNYNSQFFPYAELSEKDFLMLLSFYGMSFGFMLINMLGMSWYLSARYNLDLLSLGWFPFVKNRVAMICLVFMTPHIMQDVYLSAITYK